MTIANVLSTGQALERVVLWENVFEKHPQLFRDGDTSATGRLNIDDYFRWLEEDPEFHYGNLRMVRTFYDSKKGYTRFAPDKRRASRFTSLDLVLKKKDKEGIDVFKPRHFFEDMAKVVLDYCDDYLKREGDFTADQLVIFAREERVGSRSPGYTDNKCLCFPKNILTLLEAGARVGVLNQKDYDHSLKPTGNFSHEVIYKDHLFLASTNEYWKYLERFMEI